MDNPKEIFRNSAGNSHLERVLQEIETRGVDHLTARQKCNLIQYLKRAMDNARPGKNTQATANILTMFRPPANFSAKYRHSPRSASRCGFPWPGLITATLFPIWWVAALPEKTDTQL